MQLLVYQLHCIRDMAWRFEGKGAEFPIEPGGAHAQEGVGRLQLWEHVLDHHGLEHLLDVFLKY